MISHLKQQQGSALLFGLVALFAASLTGLSLMQLSQSDKMSSVDFARMRSSAVAAQAALRACEEQLESQPQLVTDLLNKYVDDSSHQWLLVSDTASSASQYRKELFPSQSQSPEVAVRMMAFDPVNYLLQVEGFGYAGRNSRQKVIGYYSLMGLGPETNYGKEYAIYMGGEGKNFDSEGVINGNVYFGAGFHFNSSGGLTVNGSFKTGASNDQSSFDGQLTVNGPAYFQTPIKSQNNSVVVNGKAGFEKDLELYSNMQLHDTSYFNADIGGNRYVNMNSNPLIPSSTINTARINTSSAIIDNGAAIDITSKLGFETGNEAPFTVDLSSIPSSKIYSSSFMGNNVYPYEIQNMYNLLKASGNLWNGYMVVKVGSGLNMQYGPGHVDANIIWIVESSIQCNGKWYKTTTTSNSLVYVKSGGQIQGFGGDGHFRGYVHVAGTGSCIYNWGSGNNFVGSLHHASPLSGFQANMSAPLNLTYDHTVISEFIDLGIVSAPAPAAGSAPPTLVLKDTKIRPILLGIHY